jgi:hypothetical protein
MHSTFVIIQEKINCKGLQHHSKYLYHQGLIWALYTSLAPSTRNIGSWCFIYLHMNTPQQNVIIILLFIPMKYKKTAICKFKWNYLVLCRNAGTCKKKKCGFKGLQHHSKYLYHQGLIWALYTSLAPSTRNIGSWCFITFHISQIRIKSLKMTLIL